MNWLGLKNAFKKYSPLPIKFIFVLIIFELLVYIMCYGEGAWYGVLIVNLTVFMIKFSFDFKDYFMNWERKRKGENKVDAVKIIILFFVLIINEYLIWIISFVLSFFMLANGLAISLVVALHLGVIANDFIYTKVYKRK